MRKSKMIKYWAQVAGLLCFLNVQSQVFCQMIEMWKVHPLSIGDLDTVAGQKYDPQFAPNDRYWIAFEADINQRRTLFLLDMKNNLRYELLMNSDTANTHLFAEPEDLPFNIGYSAGLAWSPVLWNNEQWFAFVGSSSGNEDIYFGNLTDLPKVYRMTSNPSLDDYPVWSPNGKQLIFVSRRTGKSDIYLISNVDDLLTKLRRSKSDGNNGKNKEKLNEEEWVRRFSDDPDEEIFPTWSRDGKYIVYTIIRTDEQGRLNSELVTKELSTGNVKTLREEKSRILRNPSFSPDGRYIALYNAGVHADETANLLVLQVIMEDGKIGKVKEKWSSENVSKFKDVKSRVHGGPYWASDGSLFFLNDRRTERNMVLKIDQESFRKLRRPLIQRYFLYGDNGVNYSIRDFDFPAEEIEKEEIIFSAQQGNRFALNTNLKDDSKSNAALIIGGVTLGAILMGLFLMNSQ